MSEEKQSGGLYLDFPPNDDDDDGIPYHDTKSRCYQLRRSFNIHSSFERFKNLSLDQLYEVPMSTLETLHSDDEQFKIRKTPITTRPQMNRRHSNDPKLGSRIEHLTPPRNRSYTNIQKSQQNTKSQIHLEVNSLSIDRRNSVGSSDVGKSHNKKSILNRRPSSGLKLFRLQKSTEDIRNNSYNELNNNNESNRKTPTTRKISELFRKKSVSSKNLNVDKNKSRSLMLLNIKSSNSLKDDELDVILRERDHAIEEWGKASTKCEELVEEIDMMLSHLVTLRNERDDLNSELVKVLKCYEEDLQERDEYIKDVQSHMTAMNDELHVVKKERGEAYDERDKLLQELYECKRVIENLEDESSVMKSEIASLKYINQMKNENESSLKNGSDSTSEDDNIIVNIDDRDKPKELLKENPQSKPRPNSLNFCDANTLRLQEKYDTLSNRSFNYHVTSLTDDYEEIAISIDLFDSRNGLKFENAFDEPHVMVSQVIPKLQSKWNIKQHDRIMSVNGADVSKLDKKIVEKMIRETTGRAVTLVLRREKSIEGRKNYADIELQMDKNNLDIDFSLVIRRINDFSIHGTEYLEYGDVITKLNSQDISKIISTIIKKMSKKYNNKTLLRVRRHEGFTDDQLDDINAHVQQAQNYLTITSFSFPSRKKSVTVSENSANKSMIIGDFNSLCSFNLQSQNNLDTYSIQKTNTLPRKGSLRKKLWRRSTVALPVIRIQKDAPYDNLEDQNNNTKLNGKSNSETLENESHNSNIYIVPPSSPTFERSPKIRKSVSERKSRYNYSPLITKDKPRNHVFVYETHSTENTPTNMTETTSDGGDHTNGTDTTECAEPTMKSSGNEKRIIKIRKTPNENIGFSVSGGNNIGIFVTQVDEDSCSALSGLQAGHRILKINSTDLGTARLDYAMKVLINQKDMRQIRLEVQLYEDYADILLEKPNDSFYIRCKKSYTTKLNKIEKTVHEGDIIHVTNSFYNYNLKRGTWFWFGEKKNSKARRKISTETKSIDSTNQSMISMDSTASSNISRTKSLSHKGIKRWMSKRSFTKRNRTASDNENIVYIENIHHTNYEILSNTDDASI